MSLFCVLRLLLPKNDGRNSYHLKANRLGKCYVRVLGISPTSNGRYLLKEYYFSIIL